MEKDPLHIKLPDLQTSPEVERAVERQQRQTGDKVPNNPNERIEAYMDRLENIFLNPDKRVRHRNLEMFRDQIYDALLIKRDKFPESYFELQQRIARERGQEVKEIPENVREQMKDTAIEDQKHSLDVWIDYLSSNDAVYPAWFKYFVWRNITKLSQFDKERGEFKKRTETTVAPYPDIYREPLAQIADIYEQVKADNQNLKEPEIRAAFEKRFPILYAELIQKSLAASIENKEEVAGAWVKYEQGQSDQAEKLFLSLEGKGTGWCTAGRSTAEAQIKSGDFYVYYTNDQDNNPTQPRLAIRMDGEHKIGEVRGILPHQNIESQMQEILDTKLAEFGPEADVYNKKSKDMKRLTEIEKKTDQNTELTQADLTFLYEIDSKIEGFGYGRDPRIAELRAKRNPNEDMLVILDCTREQIAHMVKEITPDTRAYVGPIETGLFQKLPANLEHVYTSFPEGKIKKFEVTIGGRTVEDYRQELKSKNINIYDWAEDLLKSQDFITSSNQEKVDLVRLTVKDLGFPNGATTDEIYQKAEEYGLDLCPPEVGPALRSSYLGTELTFIAMKQIADRSGLLSVFSLGSDDGGLWLGADSAYPSRRWLADLQFVFRLRKAEA